MSKRLTLSRLLLDACARPERLALGFAAFGRFALRNQILALRQCDARSLPPGPLATEVEWSVRGCEVLAGERPIFLSRLDPEPRSNGGDVHLRLEGRWFVESQTTVTTSAYSVGRDPHWRQDRVLARLGVVRLAFAPAGAGITGYSFKRFVAVDPRAAYPEKTLFHELAHIRLGHSKQFERRSRAGQLDGREEVMAEAVAMLLAGALGMPGCAESGALLQPAFANCSLAEPDAARIFEVADEILAAGRPGPRPSNRNGRRVLPLRGKPR